CCGDTLLLEPVTPSRSRFRSGKLRRGPGGRGPLAPVTSPLGGSTARSAIGRGYRAAESNKYPPPHPSPTRGEGAECGLPSAESPRKEGGVPRLPHTSAMALTCRP